MISFEVVRVCSFFCCNGVCKSGLSSTETKFEWDTSIRHKGIYAAFSNLIASVSVVQFTVQMSKLNRLGKTYRKRIFIVELKTSLALLLRTNCLREFTVTLFTQEHRYKLEKCQETLRIRDYLWLTHVYFWMKERSYVWQGLSRQSFFQKQSESIINSHRRLINVRRFTSVR